jgi:tetratricopeptide (TPR) repeat protein
MHAQFARRTHLNSLIAAVAIVLVVVSSVSAQPRTTPAPAGTGAATPAPAGGGATVPNPLAMPSGTPSSTATPAGGTNPAAADPTAPTAGKQTPTEWLIGSAVEDPNSPQFKDITDAIEKFTKGELAEAEKQLSQARKSDQRIPPAEILVARLFALAGQLAPARAQLERAVVAEPRDPEPYLLFAEVAIQERRITDAKALLTEAKQLVDSYSENPKRRKNFDIRVNAGLSAIAEARSQWESAEKYLQEWIKIDEKNASAHQRLGRVMFQRGNPSEALKELNKAVTYDSNAVNPYIFLAQLYEEVKQHADAQKQINTAVRMNPKDLNVHLLAAKWALATNEMKDAQAYADAATKIDGSSVEAKVAAGTVARMRGDLKTAERLLSEAVAASPANLDASNQLALVLVEDKDPVKQKRAADIAQLNMRATTQGNQFSPEAYTTAAWVLYKLGNIGDAEKVMQQVLQTQRLSQDGAYYIARMLTDRKPPENEKAILVLEQAIAQPAPFAQREKAAELLAQLKRDKK